MNKLLRLIGLGEIKYKFTDFEINLRTHYIANMAIDVVLFVCGLVFGITTQYLPAILIFAGVIVLSVGAHLYGLLQLLTGQVLCFEGECKETNKQVLKVLKAQVYGKSNIEVFYDGHTYITPVRHNAPFKEGTMVRVYFLDGGIYQKDEDTFAIPNPVYVSKIKN